MTTAPSPPARPFGGPLRLRRLRVITALMLREMGARFGRSAGGYLWAIAEPLAGILLLSIAFSLALRTPGLGTSFLLFYATGVVPFSMFRSMAGGVAGAISSNRGLLTYPVVTALDAVFAKFALNFMTAGLVGTVLFVTIILVFDLYVSFEFAAILTSFALASLLGLGVGVMNCVLFGFFPTWKNIWSVLTRPLFIVSGVFFTFESVPPAFQAVMWWNPLVHVIAMMRKGFYGFYEPTFVSYPYVLGLALGLLVLGGYLVRRHASFLIEQ